MPPKIDDNIPIVEKKVEKDDNKTTQKCTNSDGEGTR